MLTGTETADILTDLVHQDTQQRAYGIDLTVGEVYRLTGSGRLDFGGSEYEAATRERMRPKKAQPEDDYGWWDVQPGTYLIRYNETLPATDHIAFLEPHERLLNAGAWHPSIHVDAPQDPLEMLLTVGERGCAIKENARISRLLLLTP